MTFCKTLKTAKTGDDIIEAVQEDGYRYYIYVMRNGSPIVNNCDIYKTARTTWQKKFNELVKALERHQAERIESMHKKMVKKLTVNNIAGTGITRTPENDWRDGYGCWHREYSYKGIEIDQLSNDSISAVYICVNVYRFDASNNIPLKEWMHTEECKTLEKYEPNNGMHTEFDICEFIADIDKAIAKYDELNANFRKGTETMEKRELINELTDAWMYGGKGTYDTDPEHIKEWLETAEGEDKENIEDYDLDELAEAIAEMVKTLEA